MFWLIILLKLVRNAIKNKFTYIGRVIEFDGEGLWSFGNNFFRNVLIFGVDNNSSYHTDNQQNDFLDLGDDPTHSIHDITASADK